MDVMQAARELGAAIAASEIHRAMRAAENRVTESGEIDLIRDYQLKQTIVARLQRGAHHHHHADGVGCGCDDRLHDAALELAEAESLVHGSEAAMDYLEKKQAFSEMMGEVNGIISQLCNEGCPPSRCASCAQADCPSHSQGTDS